MIHNFHTMACVLRRGGTTCTCDYEKSFEEKITTKYELERKLKKANDIIYNFRFHTKPHFELCQEADKLLFPSKKTT